MKAGRSFDSPVLPTELGVFANDEFIMPIRSKKERFYLVAKIEFDSISQKWSPLYFPHPVSGIGIRSIGYSDLSSAQEILRMFLAPWVARDLVPPKDRSPFMVEFVCTKKVVLRKSVIWPTELDYLQSRSLFAVSKDPVIENQEG